jgi:hypothetical protein
MRRIATRYNKLTTKYAWTKALVRYIVRIGRVFHLDQVAEAHRCMEEDSAGGKIVVLTS